MTSNQRRHLLAFTMIELLVVISLIAVLAALLMPAVSTVRAAARQAQCSGNERQMMLAILSYAGENTGYAPPADGGVTRDSCRTPHAMLMHHDLIPSACVLDWNPNASVCAISTNIKIRWPNPVACPSVEGSDQLHWFYSVRFWGNNKAGADVFKHVLISGSLLSGGAAKVATLDPKVPYLAETCSTPGLITGYWVNDASATTWPTVRISHRNRAVVGFADGRTAARTMSELMTEDGVYRVWSSP